MCAVRIDTGLFTSLELGIPLVIAVLAVIVWRLWSRPAGGQGNANVARPRMGSGERPASRGPAPLRHRAAGERYAGVVLRFTRRALFAGAR